MSHYIWRWDKLSCVLVACVLASLLLSCQTPQITDIPPISVIPSTDSSILPVGSMSAIPFRILTQGNAIVSETDKPVLAVIGKAAEVGQLLPMVDDPPTIEKIRAIDFTTTYVVAIFSGSVSSSGYSATVQDINKRLEEVSVTVKITPPSPEIMVADVISYPYQIVTIDRHSLPVATSTLWSMYGAAGGKPMAQIQYP